MEYASDYRNTALLIPGYILLLLGWFGWIAFIFMAFPGDRVMELFLWSAGAVVAGMIVLMLLALRVHAWTITADALHVVERPKVPGTGFARQAALPFAAIGAVEYRENGIDRYLDVVSGGRRYRMPQAMARQTGPQLAIGTPDPNRDLSAFHAALREAAARVGVTLPPMRARLGFFSGWAGLCVLGIVFLLCLALAVAAVWMLIEGERPSGRSNGGEGLVLGLPVVTGWLLRKAWRQRRAVLASGAT